MNARFAAFLAALAIASGSVDAALPRVHPGVHRALRNDGTVNLILELAQTTESTLESFKESAFFSRSTKIDALKSKLQAQSQVAASEVTKFLSQESTGLYSGFKSFWISNQVYVENASFDLVEKLAALDSIGTIREQFVVKIDKPEVVDDIKKLVGQEWDVKIIGAPKVWADGNIGQDVVVASLDTGVRWTHEALKQNFRGAYSWYDPEFKTDEPYDVDIHGTHAMGTIASTNGVGVAPGATWMSYKICRVEDCYEANMLEYAQFVLCPTDTQGNNPDCSKAPHVVSNSWGFTSLRRSSKPPWTPGPRLVSSLSLLSGTVVQSAEVLAPQPISQARSPSAPRRRWTSFPSSAAKAPVRTATASQTSSHPVGEFALLSAQATRTTSC